MYNVFERSGFRFSSILFLFINRFLFFQIIQTSFKRYYDRCVYGAPFDEWNVYRTWFFCKFLTCRSYHIVVGPTAAYDEAHRMPFDFYTFRICENVFVVFGLEIRLRNNKKKKTKIWRKEQSRINLHEAIDANSKNIKKKKRKQKCNSIVLIKYDNFYTHFPHFLPCGAL